MSTRGLEVGGRRPPDHDRLPAGARACRVARYCDPGDTILVEDPTYLAALQTFQLADVNAQSRSRATSTAPTPRR